MIYPQKITSKKSDIIIKSLAVASIVIALILFVINKLTTPKISWSAISNCGIAYIWISVIYSIKKGTNIAGHVLLQTILISLLILYLDRIIGFSSWSIYIGIPIVLIVANITMLILTIISYKQYIKYAIYQLIIVLMSLTPIILIAKNIIELKVLNTIAIGISILNFVISLVLCNKDIKDAIIRKIHL